MFYLSVCIENISISTDYRPSVASWSPSLASQMGYSVLRRMSGRYANRTTRTSNITFSRNDPTLRLVVPESMASKAAVDFDIDRSRQQQRGKVRLHAPADGSVMSLYARSYVQ